MVREPLDTTRTRRWICQKKSPDDANSLCGVVSIVAVLKCPRCNKFRGNNDLSLQGESGSLVNGIFRSRCQVFYLPDMPPDAESQQG